MTNEECIEILNRFQNRAIKNRDFYLSLPYEENTVELYNTEINAISHTITALSKPVEPESTRSQMKRKLMEHRMRIEQLETLNSALMAELASGKDTNVPSKEPCECKAEYAIIDDDFGKPIDPNMIYYCWNCGRDLKGGE